MNTARREQRDLLLPQEPGRCLRRVARVGVLRQDDDQPTIDLFVQRGEHQRQHRLRNAGAHVLLSGGERGGELREPLLRAQAFDEAVEHGTVHDDWPNRAFGRSTWYFRRGAREK
ncbi:MAG: hypothetical protein QOH95_518 [Gaiellaceae bacterium]|nr:hypothetical protein [Gaiellaceae bacterium]